MISLYTWHTPNGQKISIMLEELGVPYQVHPVNLGAQQQLLPEFLVLSPNNKVPAIVDHDANGLSIFESGAILTYLAEKHGRFLESSGPGRYKALEWLNWHVGGIGPMMARLFYFFYKWDNESPLATRRIADEIIRLINVMESHLNRNTYLAADDYTIADIASFPWIVAASAKNAVLGDILVTRPALTRWINQVGQRPAVRRGMAVPRF